MTQQHAAAMFMPLIEAGLIYDKFAKVDARPAVEGEKIVTFTSDGKETENTAKAGDYVIRAHTEAREQYILGRDKLAKRYKLIGPAADEGWETYQATGSCKAAVYNGPEIKFTASWGEDMVIKKGDMIVTALPDKDSVYRIAAKEFGETYALREGIHVEPSGAKAVYAGGKRIGWQG